MDTECVDCYEELVSFWQFAEVDAGNCGKCKWWNEPVPLSSEPLKRTSHNKGPVKDDWSFLLPLIYPHISNRPNLASLRASVSFCGGRFWFRKFSYPKVKPGVAWGRVIYQLSCFSWICLCYRPLALVLNMSQRFWVYGPPLNWLISLFISSHLVSFHLLLTYSTSTSERHFPFLVITGRLSIRSE